MTSRKRGFSRGLLKADALSLRVGFEADWQAVFGILKSVGIIYFIPSFIMQILEDKNMDGPLIPIFIFGLSADKSSDKSYLHIAKQRLEKCRALMHRDELILLHDFCRWLEKTMEENNFGYQKTANALVEACPMPD